jgi:hypothetical protein
MDSPLTPKSLRRKSPLMKLFPSETIFDILEESQTESDSSDVTESSSIIAMCNSRFYR